MVSPSNACEELIVNGNAEGDEPILQTNFRDTLTKEVEEDGNKYWKQVRRHNYRSSVRFVFPNLACLEKGVTYVVSSRVRLHYSDGFVGGSESYYWYISYINDNDGVHWDRREQTVLECPAQTIDDGWVTCSGLFMVDEVISDRNDLYIAMSLRNTRDGHRYELDFDDISFRYHKGYVHELVVDSDDISCWGSGSDVHVTSASYYNMWNSRKTNGFVSQIINVIDNGDGTANLQLSESAALPIISQEDNYDYAVEVVLLSRNILIKGDSDENEKGGYVQVLRTPEISQKINGIEFVNMGRKTEEDRFVSDSINAVVESE